MLFDSGELALSGDPGESSNLRISATATAIVFEGAGVSGDAERCAPVAEGLSCRLDGVRRLTVRLHEEGDTLVSAARLRLRPIRYEGGDGDDRITGGPSAESISGGQGNDRLSGGAGNDGLNGSEGNDVVSTGSGRNSASGDVGNDRLMGGRGRDTLGGDGGNDRVDGGSGNDSLSGGPGADRLNGGAGRDSLQGNVGPDRISGGPGDDDIFSVDGSRDVIRCGRGRDRVRYERRDRLSRDCEERSRSNF